VIIGDYGQIKGVLGLTPQEEQGAKDFMLGAVYCRCKNQNGEWFAVRDLFGGDNFDWGGTPLRVLYEKEKGKGKEDLEAIDEAGKSAGRLLKKTLFENEKRSFESKKEGMTRKYKWVKG